MNELTDQAIPSEEDEVSAMSNGILEMMDHATKAGISDAAVILAILSAATSAVERVEGMQAEEAMPSGMVIKVTVTDSHAPAKRLDS